MTPLSELSPHSLIFEFAAHPKPANLENLLKTGIDVDPNCMDSFGNTALTIATLFRQDHVMTIDEGYLKVIRCLLKHGADPTIMNRSGDSAAVIAARYGDREVINLFYSFGMVSPQTTTPSGLQIEDLLRSPPRANPVKRFLLAEYRMTRSA